MIEIINEQDFERLFEIEQKAHLVPWSKGTLLNNQGEKYLNLKLVENEQIVAFAISQIVLDEATLFNIAVDPAFQHQGFGKRLLSELILQLQQKGIATLWLEVRESNIAAQRLYNSLGFNEVTIRKNYYPTPEGGKENAVIMALYL
ncbi:ribosomal protein S18-alanine N-acetyltransferase [Mannheimia sp. AT1]|uniref:[Ribosomal protein bS18]-alanine N-acetyltransferase n=1 Tax=Mannheimia cairinae TaxID=3025936 RepID=A0ABT5MQM1_9PAST|nr:ribosomal protein S18-alanine N-acetyltransferase [Mannheimia cairinae]MDD0825095.1 ribosomal protein S18-alanine N-acetyltransferase [Mannheimia cairinae]